MKILVTTRQLSAMILPVSLGLVRVGVGSRVEQAWWGGSTFSFLSLEQDIGSAAVGGLAFWPEVPGSFRRNNHGHQMIAEKGGRHPASVECK